MLSEMGSLVLAQPMFARLKQRYPGAALHLLLLGKNRDVADMLGVVPDRQRADDRRPHAASGFARECLRVLRRLRTTRIDVVIDCELFSRISAILSYLAGAPVRVGFDRHTQEGLYRGSIVNRPVLYNPYRHMSRQFLTLADAIESTSSPPCKDVEPVEATPDAPVLVIAPAELERTVLRRLRADFPAIAGRPLALVYAGGGVLPERAWPLAHFQTLSAALVRDGYAVATIGLAENRAEGDAIAAHCASPYCVNLAGWTRSLRELVTLFHHAALLVTNDGGPAQFSALTRVPTVALFGPETPLLYAPLGNRADVPAPRAPLLALPHRVQPPPHAVRRRQPVHEAHHARRGAGARARHRGTRTRNLPVTATSP